MLNTTGKVCVPAMVVLLLTGCAGLYVNEANDGADGIRYYQRAPFLLVYSDNSGGLTSKLVYLPDTRKVMSAYPYAILATNKTSLEFSEGVLTSGEVDADSAAIPKAVVAALEKVATGLLAAAKNKPDEKKTVPSPVLYRIDFKDGKLTLVGSGKEYEIQFGPAPDATPVQPAKTDKKTVDATTKGGAQ